jgi:DNA-binding NarL/FixJ family response regulator
MKTKILLVDDHPMTRNGARELLGRQPDLDVVGEASSGEPALRLARELRPDVVLMDIHLLGANGIETTRRILAELPDAKVIIFSCEMGRDFVDQALQAGACGYVVKTSALEELAKAIEWVMEGKLYLSPEMSAGILEDYRRGLAGGPMPSKPVLSERERQLLRLVAEGRRNKEIADQMAVSAKSVETYRSRLMKKLGYSSSAELVRHAIREGIAPP